MKITKINFFLRPLGPTFYCVFKTSLFCLFGLHVSLGIHAQQAGGYLFDGESADLPAVEHGGQGAPVGFLQLQAAQALAVGGVGGGIFDEGTHLGRRTSEHSGGDGFPSRAAFHGEEHGEEVLHHVVGLEAGLGGTYLVGHLVGGQGAGGLLNEEIDDVAVGERLGVLLVDLGIHVGGIGHTGAPHRGEVAHEVGLGINHADAEEGLI